MSKQKSKRRTQWQKTFLSELYELSKVFPETLEVITSDIVHEGDELIVPVMLNVGELPKVPEGLPLRSEEKLLIKIPASFFQPPSVEVDHLRFLGYPHVLQGQRICLFLDPSREWHPHNGVRGVLNRLWEWLSDAAGKAFDSSKALYHAVGGVLHRTPGTPAIVYRENSATESLKLGYLSGRSPERMDFSWKPSTSGLYTPVLTLTADLPFGATSNLSTLLAQIDDPNFTDVSGPKKTGPKRSEAFFSALLSSAIRNPNDSHQYFILAVPHPAGGPPHLLAGRLSLLISNGLRRAVEKHGSVLGLNAVDFNLDLPLEWCYMSDERSDTTTRRDHSRPVNWFYHKNVLVWGCGGLGSWVAELVARAGASSITVCDPGIITGGLLVRQNYMEQDLGSTKAEALAYRLRKINDKLEVVSQPGTLIEPDVLSDFDLIMDATISHSTSVYLDALKAQNHELPTIMQVATDARTGTLGVMHVLAPDTDPDATPSQLDASAGATVMQRSELEMYRELWQDVPAETELIPTRGCSVPTFHGSAADLISVAATLTNIMGRHMQVTQNDLSGTYLTAPPHAFIGPPYVFLPLEPSLDSDAG